MADFQQGPPRRRRKRPGNGQGRRPEKRKFRTKSLIRNLLIEILQRSTLTGLGIFAGCTVAGVLILWVLFSWHPKPKTEPYDLGQGVVSAEGLRGHLVTQWDGKVAYKLKIEPLDPRYSSAFAYVAAHPAARYSLHIRLLDSSGFPLCDKTILFSLGQSGVITSDAGPVQQSDDSSGDPQTLNAVQQPQNEPLRTQGGQGGHGIDVMQNQRDDDGTVVATTADGVIPCTAEQYRRVDYWDLSSTFPTVPEQHAIMRAPAVAAAKRRAEEEAAERRRRAQIHPMTFYAQGDETVTSFDANHGVLQSTAGNSFYVPNKGAQGIASFWAANSTLIHYKCDQRGNCTITSAGGRVSIHAQLFE
jgi:hypothetical protein